MTARSKTVYLVEHHDYDNCFVHSVWTQKSAAQTVADYENTINRCKSSPKYVVTPWVCNVVDQPATS